MMCTITINADMVDTDEENECTAVAFHKGTAIFADTASENWLDTCIAFSESGKIASDIRGTINVTARKSSPHFRKRVSS